MNGRPLPGLPAGTLGNDSVPNRPFRLPNGKTAGAYDLTPPQAGPQGINPNSSVGGIYVPFQKDTFTLVAAAAPTMLLIEPDGKRVFLQIRVTRDSTGILLIGLGNEASTPQAADLELAGGEAWMLDYAVPQNRVFGFARTADVEVVVTYANWEL